MTSSAAPQLNDESFDDIERAVQETARGRWFLNEFARRARAVDTNVILGAIARMEQRLDEIAGIALPTQAAPPASAPAPSSITAPAHPSLPPAENAQPIEALMARLSAALEETGREMREVEPIAGQCTQMPAGPLKACDDAKVPDGPKTFEDIGKLSPEERLRLFY